MFIEWVSESLQFDWLITRNCRVIFFYWQHAISTRYQYDIAIPRINMIDTNVAYANGGTHESREPPIK